MVDRGKGDDFLKPFDAAMPPGHNLGTIDFSCGRRGENINRKRALAGARNAADDGEVADGERGGDSLKVMFGGVLNGEQGLARRFSRNDACERGPACEVCPGPGVLVRGTGLGGSFEDDATAVDARPWAHLDEMVRREHHVAVMFYDDHGIAEVAQAVDGTNKTAMVARVQPDTGFVEHVRDAHQPEAELRGESYALSFAAGE